MCPRPLWGVLHQHLLIFNTDELKAFSEPSNYKVQIMGNIVTSHINLFTRLDFEETNINMANVSAKLLSGYFGNTYNSPYFINTVDVGEIHVSLTEKWSSHITFEVIKSFDAFEKVFVRWCERHDQDQIYFVPNRPEDSQKISKPCEYLFDSITFKDFPGAESITKDCQRVDDDYYLLKVDGRFLSCNDISSREGEMISYPIESYRQWLRIDSEILSPSESIATIIGNSKNIFLMFDGKTVEQRIHTDLIRSRLPQLSSIPEAKAELFAADSFHTGMITISSCSWGNCGDEAYLNYITTRKRAVEEYRKEFKKRYGY